ALLAPGFLRRLRLQLERLQSLGVHIPGRRGELQEIALPDALAAEIERAGMTTTVTGKPAPPDSLAGPMKHRRTAFQPNRRQKSPASRCCFTFQFQRA